MTKVWVVVADGEHARVVAPTTAHGQFATVLAFDSSAAHLRAHDLGSDRPGRSYERASPMRHAITPRHDLHDQAKHAFILEVARQVNGSAAAGEFDRLVLVAPGHALLDLREALSAIANSKIVGSVAKDLTKMPDHELASHLAEWWLRPAKDTE
jgi:protein required for attachment to host cells